MTDPEHSFQESVARRIRSTAAVKWIKPRHVTEATGLSTYRARGIFAGRMTPTITELADIAFTLDVDVSDLLPLTLPDDPTKTPSLRARLIEIGNEAREIAETMAHQADPATLKSGRWPTWAAVAKALDIARDQMYLLTRDL